MQNKQIKYLSQASNTLFWVLLIKILLEPTLSTKCLSVRTRVSTSSSFEVSSQFADWITQKIGLISWMILQTRYLQETKKGFSLDSKHFSVWQRSLSLNWKKIVSLSSRLCSIVLGWSDQSLTDSWTKTTMKWHLEVYTWLGKFSTMQTSSFSVHFCKKTIHCNPGCSSSNSFLTIQFHLNSIHQLKTWTKSANVTRIFIGK